MFFQCCLTYPTQYVVDLSEGDHIDTVRFQLSSHVRARYGAPENSVLYHDHIHRSPLSITLDIEMTGTILGATSLNHNPFHDVPVPPTTMQLVHLGPISSGNDLSHPICLTFREISC